MLLNAVSDVGSASSDAVPSGAASSTEPKLLTFEADSGVRYLLLKVFYTWYGVRKNKKTSIL